MGIVRRSDRPRVSSRVDFFREFLKHPRQVGSIIPSSRFLERRVLAAAGIASADTIVELGPGTGGTTRAILRAMPRHATLLTIDINPRFHAVLSGIEDDRLIPHLGSACDLREILSEYDLDRPNVIVSGIPFSTMGDRVGTEIIAAIASVLAPRGRFVAYQVRDNVATLGKPILGSPQIALELLNILPMRIFMWEKSVN